MSSETTVYHEGELSESSEDDSINKSDIKEVDTRSGVVVSGEASESDSDEGAQEASSTKQESQKEDKKITEPGEIEVLDVHVNETPKYNTLLHRKLREKNIQFRGHLQHFFSDMYSTGSKDIKNISTNANKSSSAIRDVSNTMRLVSNDLFQLEDKVDIVATCSILPDIKLPSIELPTTPS